MDCNEARLRLVKWSSDTCRPQDLVYRRILRREPINPPLACVSLTGEKSLCCEQDLLHWCHARADVEDSSRAALPVRRYTGWLRIARRAAGCGSDRDNENRQGEGKPKHRLSIAPTISNRPPYLA